MQLKNNMMIFKDIDSQQIPVHVAIIMDGNGRWAKKQNKERFFGHRAGAEAARIITETAAKIGVKYLTLYAFSKENWNRPKDEVHNLMDLLITGVSDNLDDLIELNVKFSIIGDRITLPQNVKKSVVKAENATRNNNGLNLIVALNYGARWEITNAVKTIMTQFEQGKIKKDEIDENVFSKYLLTKEIPDPDLLIRTSGENRISNFLLWQLSYSELYFTPILWPDFLENEFLTAIHEYQNRERRYGKTSEQMNKKGTNESDN